LTYYGIPLPLSYSVNNTKLTKHSNEEQAMCEKPISIIRLIQGAHNTETLVLEGTYSEKCTGD